MTALSRPTEDSPPPPTSRADAHVPTPRRARFDWADVPLHWIPDDAHSTHVINSLHLFLPAGERWFVKVMKQALPLVTDDLLHQQVRAFMSQEGIHATAHGTASAHLRAHGIDHAGYDRRLEIVFDNLLGDHPLPGRRLQRAWLDVRLAIIAAIEHYTAVLGDWILEADALDEAGADPVMLDLLRWHGAEEVEHRSVAFDLYQHLNGSWPLRATVAQVVFPTLLALMLDGTRVLMGQDPDAPRFRPMKGYVAGMDKGRLPKLLWLALQGPRYTRPGYHPSREGDMQRALDYIARSPSHVTALG